MASLWICGEPESGTRCCEGNPAKRPIQPRAPVEDSLYVARRISSITTYACRRFHGRNQLIGAGNVAELAGVWTRRIRSLVVDSKIRSGNLEIVYRLPKAFPIRRKRESGRDAFGLPLTDGRDRQSSHAPVLRNIDGASPMSLRFAEMTSNSVSGKINRSAMRGNKLLVTRRTS